MIGERWEDQRRFVRFLRYDVDGVRGWDGFFWSVAMILRRWREIC